MLVLSRKLGENIRVGDDIKVIVLDVRGGQVKLGNEAPQSVAVHRQGVYARIQDANRQSAAKPQQPQRDEHRHEREVVAAGQRLQQERRAQRTQPYISSRREPLMKRQQDQRQTVRRQQLQVRQVTGAERIETEDQAADEGGRATGREGPDQRICRGGRKPPDQQKRDAVHGQR